MKLYKMPFFNTIRNMYLKKYYKNYDSSKVKAIKDIHKNERCFLLGTGPSLDKQTLKIINKEIIFGTNTTYKLSSNFTYYCVSDKNVWENHKGKILKQNAQLLLSGHAGRDFLINNYKTMKEAIAFKDLGDIKRYGWLDKDLTHGTYWGNSIMVDCCLQIAYWMGFKEVYLLGCDCTYETKHHFDGEVFKFQKDTDRYYNMHWKKVFEAHKIIDEEYRKDGRQVFNATPEGNLDVYERVKLEDVI